MSSSFCDCRLPNTFQIRNNLGSISDLLQCRCGEIGVSNVNPWAWNADEKTNALVSGRDIIFNPIKSRGTSIVRGSRSLKPGMVHFWEMLAISPLFGTDVMFGIGTQSVDLAEYKSRYRSALGRSEHSWGFSYSGNVQHCGIKTSYCQEFSKGSLIGVYLDRSRGHLEFFLNRKRLGLAYTNVPVNPNVDIYPMVCSTALQSVIRLVNSTSMPDTLLLRSFQALSTDQRSELRKIPGLEKILKFYWFLDMPFLHTKR
ncbi:SPRY domain-containing SOCS box protein 3-like [Drosophila ficusphila]|uniref:SPRY domain-containing SOCS box protein 3-like n=1 Tax=Drosophila ficusphila TaxID=30025 RepID=UPI0007E7EAF0|nr:SPRY domain-containing SOCS box protein 3-like [Drosophila ficusphila]